MAYRVVAKKAFTDLTGERRAEGETFEVSAVQAAVYRHRNQVAFASTLKPRTAVLEPEPAPPPPESDPAPAVEEPRDLPASEPVDEPTETQEPAAEPPPESADDPDLEARPRRRSYRRRDLTAEQP